MEVNDLVNEAVQGLGSIFTPTMHSAITSYNQNPLLHPFKVQREKDREDNFREKAVLLDLLSKDKGLNNRSIVHDGNENTLWPTITKNSNPTFEQQLEMIDHFKGVLPFYNLKEKYPDINSENALELEKENVRFARPKYY